MPEDGTGLLSAILASWTATFPIAAGWFLVGSGAFGVATAAAVLRYLILLRGSGLAPDWRAVLRAYLFANFVGMLLPSGVMGDAYRFVDARRDTGRGVEVLSALVVERLLGLASLCAVGLMAAPFVPSWNAASSAGRDSDTHLAWMLIAGSGVVFVSVSVALHPLCHRLGRNLVGLLRKLSDRLANMADRGLDAVSAMSRQPGLISRAFALSLVCQWLPVCGVLALSQPLDTSVEWYWFPVIVPFVMAVSLLPVSLGGAGVRESLYVALFGAAGMRPEVALSLSLSVVAANLVWGLLGLALFVFGRSNVDSRKHDVTGAPDNRQH